MKRIVNVLDKLNWRRRPYAVLLLCAMTAIFLPAQTFTTVFDFSTGGAYPEAGLVQATNGDLYGTTAGGGNSNAACSTFLPGTGCGTIFKITPSGTLTMLYSFCSQSGCSDGANPFAGLVQATNGDLYGTTAQGGINCAPNGCGTVFKITPSGTLTTLHSFAGYPTEGSYPSAALVQATNGDLYGTTYSGGANGPYDGTVFKITPSGTLTTLYSFCPQGSYPNCPDGVLPVSALVQAANGDLYGTTSDGATVGTVFKITPTGTLTTVYSFCPSAFQCTDGSAPLAGLVQAPNGDFYGTTNSGGTYDIGTIFKITAGGTLTTLYSFGVDGNDGVNPLGLVRATDGDFYGTTQGGGIYVACGPYHGCGTIFKVTPSGVVTTLYSFCPQPDCPDGWAFYAALTQYTNGELYGTTIFGGIGTPNGYGTIFSLSVGLGPFVETQPTSGKVGAAVKILGTNLTGVTSVTFNGTPAVITFTQPSEISTTVPSGATSGKVQVTTPKGTLLSNVPFRVVP